MSLQDDLANEAIKDLDDYVNTQPIDRGSTSCSTSAQDCGSAHLAYHFALCARDIHE